MSKDSFHPVTHIIFDCDGLLVDSEKYYSEALSEVAAKYGKQFTFQIKLEMMGELFNIDITTLNTHALVWYANDKLCQLTAG